jgi:FAD binding domain
MVDRTPALIVRPLDAADVAAAVEFAAAFGLTVSVRGGGHNVAGHAVCGDGVMIDLRLMREVAVDPVDRVARWAAVRPGTTSTRPAGAEAPLRPGEPLPAQPEHPSGRLARIAPGRNRTSARGLGNRCSIH